MSAPIFVPADLVTPPGAITADEYAGMLRTWQAFARPAQLRPKGCRRWWNRQAGRGEGKTRSASEYTLDICEDWGPVANAGIAGRTIADTRETLIHGPAGLIRCAEARGYELDHRPSRGKIFHPSGAEIRTYGGDVPRAFRGFSGNFFWADELAFWQDPVGSFKVINDTMRALAPDPGAHGLITSTPWSRGDVSRMLVSEFADLVTTTRGRFYDNVDNLDPGTRAALEAGHGGTHTSSAREELDGELLDGSRPAFCQDVIDRHREVIADHLEIREVIVSIDPAAKDKKSSDATGIIALGVGGPHEHKHFYVLDDATIQGVQPGVWADIAIDRAMYMRHRFKCGVRILIEDNNGGDQCVFVLDTRMQARGVTFPVQAITARQSKIERADAAGVVYEAGRVHHVGVFPDLEKQLTKWYPGKASPDRMDALTQAVLDAALDKVGPLF
jgi:phage terminase large subunit-like protein